MVADPTHSSLVKPEDECPRCRERDPDRLVWQEDGERVECQTCGQVYKPLAQKGGRHDRR